MKTMFKRIMPLLLAVVLCVSLAAPAFADSALANSMMSFPTQKTTSYNVNYTRIIQSAMYAYGGYPRTQIMNNGGTDGIFGSATYNAVYKFQLYEALDQDGIVGTNTWAQIGRLGELESNTYYKYKIGNYYYVMVSSIASGIAWKYYNYANGSTGFTTAFVL